MSWFRGDDRLHSCEKWAPLSFAARGLWAHANSWVADRRTDGHVPRNMLRAWGAPAELAAELVDAKLWDVTDTGWVFHNWLDYNPSAQELAERATASNERVTAFRARKKRDCNAVANAHVTPLPVPIPGPKLQDCTIRAPAREEHSPCRVGNDFMLAVNASLTWDYSSWRRELEVIGEKPETQRVIALETIRSSVWCRTNAQAVHPGHVVKYWNRYASGKEAVTQIVPKRGMTEPDTHEQHAAAAAAQARGEPLPWEM